LSKLIIKIIDSGDDVLIHRQDDIGFNQMFACWAAGIAF